MNHRGKGPGGSPRRAQLGTLQHLATGETEIKITLRADDDSTLAMIRLAPETATALAADLRNLAEQVQGRRGV